MQRILVVDDHLDLLELLSISFEGIGFSVVTATKGPDALKRAREVGNIIDQYPDGVSVLLQACW